MSKNLSKLLTFVFAAFSVISAFFSVFAIQQSWIRIGILTCTLLCIVVSGLFFLKVRQYDNAASVLSGALGRRMPESSSFELRTINNKVELKEVWNISQSIYGADNVDFDKVISWWQCYHNGIYILCRDHTIAGYLSMWPIKKQTFKDIIRGSRRERELKAQSILGYKSQKPRTYWYITNIVVRKQFKKEKAVIVLLRGALAKWLAEANLDSEIYICALGYSKEGEAMLKRYGFRKYKEAEETLDKQPLYVNILARQDVVKVINSLNVS